MAIDKIVIFKKEREMNLWKDGEIIRTYDIKLSIKLNDPNFKMGHKFLRGDFKTPEGEYKIQRRNTEDWRRFKDALLINYPNKEDIKRAKKFGIPVKDLGSDILIHGYPKSPNKVVINWVKNNLGWLDIDESTIKSLLETYFYPYFDWTEGCVALSPEDMRELFKLVKVGTPVIIHHKKLM